MKMCQRTILCFLILISIVDGKKIFKQLKDKNVLKSAAMMAGGVALSEMSWGQIDSEFSYLEQRVALLEEVYHNEISEGMEEIQILQSSIYPIFAVFILASLTGIIILSRKINKDDLVGFLAKASRIPEYLHRIRSSNVFANNQNSPTATAPYIHPNHHEMLPHRSNPYFNGFSGHQMANEPIINPSVSRNNATLEQGDHGGR